MDVLIVGAGIAGATLAYWLVAAGHRPTLVERAPELRRGGYLVDFWGAGFDVAERMGILPELMREGYRLEEVRQVDGRGRRIASFSPEAFVRGSEGRYVSIARGDLASAVYAALGGRVETLFGDTVQSLEDDGEHVHVSFESGRSRDFDIVVGADGLHSRVRELVFGAEAQFERYLGLKVAAFDVEGYRPRDDLSAVMHTEVGLQVIRVALRGDVTMFLFTLLDDDDGPLESVEEQQAYLRSRLAAAGWEVPAILDGMPAARTFYFDRVSQIRMPAWTRGRVALVGDAAACVSLLAGQGSALAMVESYVLAAELGRTRGTRYAEAFARYEELLAPFLLSKQRAAESFATAFAPRSKLKLLLRNSIMKLMGLPFVADLLMGRSLRDAIELPPAPGA